MLVWSRESGDAIHSIDPSWTWSSSLWPDGVSFMNLHAGKAFVCGEKDHVNDARLHCKNVPR